MLKPLNIKSRQRTEFIDITDKIQEIIRESKIDSGICSIYVPHTTAGITINEGADPSVQKDIQNALTRFVPPDMHYFHEEGNSDAHIKSSIMGASQTVIIDEGKLLLGTWQAIYFCEFDGPRSRHVFVKLIPQKS